MVSRRIVIVGGDAAGMSAAGKAKRTDPNAEVIVLERSEYVSYAACGLPYLLEGIVPSADELIARTPEEHRAHGIDLRLRHEVTRIDPRAHVVTVRTPEGETTIDYDRLILATGASPRWPEFARVEFEGVFPLRTIPHALAIRRYLDNRRPKRAVLIGGGYIGMEMAEALRSLDLDVTLVEHGPRVLKVLDPEMSALVAETLERHGVTLLFERVTEALLGDAHVEAVRFADGETLSADLVVVGVGAVPNVSLAEEAGLRIGDTGAIWVDATQRTSDLHIYAAGDCAEALHRLLDRNVYIPLGTTANKQGRIAGENAVGGRATFGGVVGTMVCKVFDCGFARTGLTDEQASAAGFRPKSAKIAAPSRASYYEDPPLVHVKLTFDERTRRLLGGQLVGDETVAKRVDVIATALHAGMTIDAFAELDLSYAPPFAPVWDPLLVAANVASR